jgi:hypothetical protein
MSTSVRSVLAFFGIYVLAVLLASTFPVGAGDAVHGGALLHPAFPHVHNDTRETATPPTPQRDRPNVSLTPAIDASAGGATEVPGTALTPPLPHTAFNVLIGPEQPLISWDLPWPIGLLKPPPDPPPTSLAFF